MSTRAFAVSTPPRPKARPGVRRIIRDADVPHNLYTILSLIQVGQDDEPVLAADKVRYKGEPVVAVVADSERAANEAVAKVQGRLRGAAGGLRRRGGAEARRAARQRDLSEELLHLYDGHDRRSCASATSTRRFATADHVLEERYQSSPIEHAPTETTGCIVVPEANGRYVCYSNTQALFFTLDNSAMILDMPFHKLHFIGGTVGGGFGGKVDRRRRADRDPRRDADRPAGQLRLSAARRRCRSPRRAAPSASTSRTA